jgi:PAS domain S-box-containing protein
MNDHGPPAETNTERASPAQEAAVIKYSSDAIIGVSLDGVIMSWNPAAEKLYGYTTEEAVGKPITIIFPLIVSKKKSGFCYRLPRERKSGTLKPHV